MLELYHKRPGETWEANQSYPVKLTVNRDVVPPGVQIVPLDITLDDKRYGELFDFLIRVRE